MMGINEKENVIQLLLKDVRDGKIGEIDYFWDGKKVVRDNIIFKRQELIQWFIKTGDKG